MLDAENPADAESAADTTEAPPQPGAPDAPTDTPAPGAAKKAAAKKTAKKATAKKATAKKATAKKATGKKATASPAEETAAETSGAGSSDPAAADTPVTEAATTAPAKKTAARKTAKKATTKKATKKTAASADAPGDTSTAPTDATTDATTGEAGEGRSTAADPTPAAAAPVPLFQPPAATRAPRRRKPATTASGDTGDVPAVDAGEGTSEGAGDGGAGTTGDKPAPRTRTRRTATTKSEKAEKSEEADESAASQEQTSDQDEDGQDDQGPGGANRRRRRRGGRRRRRSGETDGPEGEAEEETGQPDAEDKAEGDGDSASSRRRRRRRRTGDDDSGSDDPANTVTRVRKPRNPEDEITSVSGSTRLEAKKQRRREGREAGRRRAPIVSEAEFLARREAVDRVMVIRQRDDLTQIAVLEDKVLVEHYVARESQTSLIGNVYLGRVQNVLPSMEAAFIDIGKGRNAVLYAGEVNWDSLGAGNGPRKIEQVLKSGQSVLVQVTKDPVGHKGARLTSQVSLPGRFLVYVPDGTTSGISRKLPDTERNRLKALLKEIVPETAGVIVRTAAEGASEEELTRDVERLTARWDDISAKVEKGNAPQLLYGEPDLTLKVVRDLFTEDFGKLVVSGDEAWDLVENYVGHVAPDLGERLERYDGDQDVFAAYRIDEQIAKALDRKVWLPSGGSLIIDRTEAMTVVDVNTGKFTGSGGNLEETVTKNNLEAAEEIVRQLRLRDIGGIIVVDFIDMVLESNRDLVLRRLVECLGRDRTRHQVAEVTSLGLVQMTRKRIGTGLLEAFSESCEHCQGRGLVIHHEPVEQRKKQDDEPRRGRRSRGRGEGDGDSAAVAPPSPPSPKELAAMARSGRQTTPVATDGDGAASADSTPAADVQDQVDATAIPSGTATDTVDDDRPAADRPSRGRRRGGRSRPADDLESAPDAGLAASAGDEPTPTEVASADGQPADVRSRPRSGRGSSRRAAGPPAVTAPASPVVVVPSAGPAAAEAPDAQATDETGPVVPVARVVTSSRRRVARRPAGPPVGGAAPDADGNGVVAGGEAGTPVGVQAEDPTGQPAADPAEGATVPAHVPIKKKGSRKR